MKFHEISCGEGLKPKNHHFEILKFHDFSCPWPPKSWNLRVTDPFFIVTTNGQYLRGYLHFSDILDILVTGPKISWFFQICVDLYQKSFHKLNQHQILTLSKPWHSWSWRSWKSWKCPKFHDFGQMSCKRTPQNFWNPLIVQKLGQKFVPKMTFANGQKYGVLTTTTLTYSPYRRWGLP